MVAAEIHHSDTGDSIVDMRRRALLSKPKRILKNVENEWVEITEPYDMVGMYLSKPSVMATSEPSDMPIEDTKPRRILQYGLDDENVGMSEPSDIPIRDDIRNYDIEGLEVEDSSLPRSKLNDTRDYTYLDIRDNLLEVVSENVDHNKKKRKKIKISGSAH